MCMLCVLFSAVLMRVSLRRNKFTLTASSVSQLIEVCQTDHFGKVKYILCLIKSNSKCIFVTSVAFELVLIYIN